MKTARKDMSFNDVLEAFLGRENPEDHFQTAIRLLRLAIHSRRNGFNDSADHYVKMAESNVLKGMELEKIPEDMRPKWKPGAV